MTHVPVDVSRKAPYSRHFQIMKQISKDSPYSNLKLSNLDLVNVCIFLIFELTS